MRRPSCDTPKIAMYGEPNIAANLHEHVQRVRTEPSPRSTVPSTMAGADLAATTAAIASPASSSSSGASSSSLGCCPRPGLSSNMTGLFHEGC